MSVVRRRSYRKVWFFAVVVFVAVGLFTFLTQSARVDDDGVFAANLGNFDAGYIISDYQMGNYTSMTEAEIQSFLDSQVSCDKGISYYNYLKATWPAFDWHFKDDHIVCMNEELFGDGETIGEGDTAAHIIWQAAQDYKINPQVLLVLLQKEQGLVTDSYPNTRQYRGATGYGCPDTAACSAKYYGFKNQVRNAASMFRTVLNGGWTNYPLGNNWIRYSAACSSGSYVNIRNLATSALYRYTPYQPNAAALAAGYGTVPGAKSETCAEYGNRNFYLYFEDWFGGITDETVKYVQLDKPRYMEVMETTDRINPRNMEKYDEVEGGRILKFVTKTIFKDGTMCLRTEYSTEHNDDACILFSDLKPVEFEFVDVDGAKERIIIAEAEKVEMRTGEIVGLFSDEMIREMVVKTTFNGKTYYVTRYDYDNSDSEYGFEEKYIEELPDFEDLENVKYMTLKNEADRINPITGEFYSTMPTNSVFKFVSAIEIMGTTYYRTEHNTINQIVAAVKEDDLVEVNFVDFESPRYMRLINDTKRINPITGELIDVLEKGRVIKFTTKIFLNGQWYYRTEHNTINGICAVVSANDVGEV